MNRLRIWLVLLLVALLPVRGALATGLPCEPAGGQANSHHAAQATATEARSDAQAASPGQAAAVDDCCDEAPATADGCALCMAVCAATPVPSAFAALPTAVRSDAVRFPPFALPALSFLSEGQERPPRAL